MRDRLPLILSTTALLVAFLGTTPLGKAAFDAVVPNNSVGTAQLRNGAVTGAKIRGDAVGSGKVKDHSLRAIDFAQGQLPAGPAGPAGPQGPSGPQGKAGPPGPSDGFDYRPAGFTAEILHPGKYATVSNLALPAGNYVLSSTAAFASQASTGLTAVQCSVVLGTSVVRSSQTSVAARGFAVLPTTAAFTLPASTAVSIQCTASADSVISTQPSSMTAIRVGSLTTTRKHITVPGSGPITPPKGSSGG